MRETRAVDVRRKGSPSLAVRVRAQRREPLRAQPDRPALPLGRVDVCDIDSESIRPLSHISLSGLLLCADADVEGGGPRQLVVFQIRCHSAATSGGDLGVFRGILR